MARAEWVPAYTRPWPAPDFYARRGLNVEAYHDGPADVRGEPIAGDVEFYLAMARETRGPVLELGCGNGRVLLPLARAGIQVTGMDLSRPMLGVLAERLARDDEAVRRRATLSYGDMCDFDLGDRFALIIIAFRSFQMLLTPEDEQRCLDCCQRHLDAGGRLVIDIFDPLLDLLVPDPPPQGRPGPARWGVHPVTKNELQVEVLSRTNDRVSQTLEEAVAIHRARR